MHDGMLEAAALRGTQGEDWARMWPRPIGRDTASGIAILERRVIDFPDVDAAEFPPESREGSRFLEYRALAAGPEAITSILRLDGSRKPTSIGCVRNRADPRE